MLDLDTSESNSEVSKPNSNIVDKSLLSRDYVTSEGAVSHNVLYY